MMKIKVRTFFTDKFAMSYMYYLLIQLMLLVISMAIIGASATTWLLYFDCKIEYDRTANSYQKDCHNVAVDDTANLTEIRRQIGPEISFLSPVKSIPSGYKVCQKSSSVSSPQNNQLVVAFLTEIYCLQQYINLMESDRCPNAC